MCALPPPPGFDLQVVSIDSLKTALAKIALNIPAEDIIRVVCEVEKAKHAETLSNRMSPATSARLLSFTLSNMLVARLRRAPKQPSGLLTTTSYFVEHPKRLTH